MIRTGTSSNPEAPSTLQYPEPPETPEKYGFRGFNASSTALPSTSHTLASPKRKRSARVPLLSTDLCSFLSDQTDDNRKPKASVATRNDATSMVDSASAILTRKTFHSLRSKKYRPVKTASGRNDSGGKSYQLTPCGAGCRRYTTPSTNAIRSAWSTRRP